MRTCLGSSGIEHWTSAAIVTFESTVRADVEEGGLNHEYLLISSCILGSV